ncbi:hypothetical protein NIES208_00285 [[Limnothrix rosea] IAM M-220]|nr:hypothetical protein NIES208_00285 [[Limnothrix rosea] IAM M-220]
MRFMLNFAGEMRKKTKPKSVHGYVKNLCEKYFFVDRSEATTHQFVGVIASLNDLNNIKKE